MLRKFFCFDLYTTGLLIGWLGLAESITSCIFSILMIENIDSIITTKDFPDENIYSIRHSLVIILGTYIAFNVIDLLASGLLIAGTVKRNRLLVVPWLINSFISLSFNAAALVACFYMTINPKTDNFTESIPFFVAFVVIFGIYVYAYLAIYSLYDDIRRSSPNSEYSSLINNQNHTVTGYPIYSRC